MPAVKYAEIRRSRQELGMKHGEFAEHCGVKTKTLANIECGHQRFVSTELVHRIAKGLGIQNAAELLAEPEQAEAEDDCADGSLEERPAA